MDESIGTRGLPISIRSVNLQNYCTIPYRLLHRNRTDLSLVVSLGLGDIGRQEHESALVVPGVMWLASVVVVEGAETGSVASY